MNSLYLFFKLDNCIYWQGITRRPAREGAPHMTKQRPCTGRSSRPHRHHVVVQELQVQSCRRFPHFAQYTQNGHVRSPNSHGVTRYSRSPPTTGNSSVPARLSSGVTSSNPQLLRVMRRAFATHVPIKVGLGITRTNADSQWNPVHNAFQVL